MKKLLLILTLACTSQYLHADDDAPHLDLFAMIGAQPGCNTTDIQQAVVKSMARRLMLAETVLEQGQQMDVPGYTLIIERVESILVAQQLRDIYMKHWLSMLDRHEVLINPFSDNMGYLTELGIIEVTKALDALEESLRKEIDVRPGTTPPISIPVSPINGRKSAESYQQGRPQSRTEVYEDEEQWKKDRNKHRS